MRTGIELCVFMGSLLLVGWSQAFAGDLLPAAKYAEIPEASVIRMSPDGHKFAMTESIAGKQVLAIQDVDGTKALADLGDFQLRWAAWKSNTRLLIGMFGSTDHFFTQGNFYQTGVERMLAMDADRTHVLDIGDVPSHPQVEDNLTSLRESDPHHVLQTLNPIPPTIDQPTATGVWRIDVDSGAREKIVAPVKAATSFLADSDGIVRLMVTQSGADLIIFVRDDGTSEWRSIDRTPIMQQQQLAPVAFVPGKPQSLYVVIQGANGAPALWAFDTKGGAPLELIDKDATFNVLVRDGVLIGYQLHNGKWKYLVPDWQHDLDIIEHALPNRDIEIIDRSTDGSRVMARAASPHGPASWWLLDTSVKPATLGPIVETYKDIVAAGIATPKQITYTARDGLQIGAWLTLPRNAGSQPIPFVVLPHGGPFACDDGAFDYTVQFLTSRGYGVLQPQFRGSTCRGAAFQERGYGQWGYAMQDDVTDGTRWLIDQKLADPKRIAIVGGSYGGYAALEGAAKEPDLYRCAAAWAPVTDLEQLKDDIRNHNMNARVALTTLGTDDDRLDAASPARHADRIKVPVLLMHGKTDFTVQVKQSERMESALKHAGKSVEAIYLDNSDHFLNTAAARRAWLEALDRFLAANLAPA